MMAVKETIMNAILLVLFIQLLFGSSCDSSRSTPQASNDHRQPKSSVANREWRSATYRGLIVGKSTAADMQRILGKPDWSGLPGDQSKDEPEPEFWNEYQSGGELPGKLSVVTDKKSEVIKRIDLTPENLSREDAVKHFGSDFVATKYDFDKCLGDEESAPLYESPEGPLLFVEYRHRGIAVAVNEQRQVTHISYVDKPIGAPSSKCKNQ